MGSGLDGGKIGLVWLPLAPCLCRHLLGWAEAFPTKHGTARVVAKKILEEIMSS